MGLSEPSCNRRYHRSTANVFIFSVSGAMWLTCSQFSTYLPSLLSGKHLGSLILRQWQQQSQLSPSILMVSQRQSFMERRAYSYRIAIVERSLWQLRSYWMIACCAAEWAALVAKGSSNTSMFGRWHGHSSPFTKLLHFGALL